jgi:FkbM family methyltransferase
MECSIAPRNSKSLTWFEREVSSRLSTLISRARILLDHYRGTVRNWYSVVPVIVLKDSDVRIQFADGETLQCRSRNDWGRFQNLVRLKLLAGRGHSAVVQWTDSVGVSHSALEFQSGSIRVRFLFAHNPLEISYQLYEIFFMNEYSDLPVSGRTVVDIGANIGDSAVYFAIRGAKKVVAFEASPGAHRRAAQNIHANGLDSKIELSLAACGDRVGWIRVADGEVTPGSWTLQGSESGVLVERITLGLIVERFGVSHGALKVDCEGCEYALLGHSGAALQAFDEVLVEYHYGAEAIEFDLRSAGFTIVRRTYPMRVPDQLGKNSMYAGTVYATRAPPVA